MQCLVTLVRAGLRLSGPRLGIACSFSLNKLGLNRSHTHTHAYTQTPPHLTTVMSRTSPVHRTRTYVNRTKLCPLPAANTVALFHLYPAFPLLDHTETQLCVCTWEDGVRRGGGIDTHTQSWQKLFACVCRRCAWTRLFVGCACVCVVCGYGCSRGTCRLRLRFRERLFPWWSRINSSGKQCRKSPLRAPRSWSSRNPRCDCFVKSRRIRSLCRRLHYVEQLVPTPALEQTCGP